MAGIRRMLEVDGSIILVAGQNVWRVDAAGQSTSIGSIPGGGIVTLSRNRHVPAQIAVSDTDGYYGVIENDVLTVVNDPDFPSTPTSNAFLDGYFGVTFNNGRWGVLGPDIGTDFDALDFAQAESNPDPAIMIAAQDREFVIYGTKSMEFWVQQPNGQTADFPFVRAAAREIGLLSPGSVKSVDQVLYWIANDGTVRRLNGYQGQRISTHAVERAITECADRDKILAQSWSRNGHNFYAISGSNFTWVYDATASANARQPMWHERKSAGLDRWMVSDCVKLGDRIIAGHYAEDRLFEMSPEAYDEAGSDLVMEVHTPPVHAFPSLLQFERVVLDLIPGVGLNSRSTDDDNPKVMLSYSDDGGLTWGPERQLSIGAQGDRAIRVIARRLGRSKVAGRTFRIAVSASVVKGVLGMAADVEKIKVQ